MNIAFRQLRIEDQSQKTAEVTVFLPQPKLEQNLRSSYVFDKVETGVAFGKETQSSGALSPIK